MNAYYVSCTDAVDTVLGRVQRLSVRLAKNEEEQFTSKARLLAVDFVVGEATFTLAKALRRSAIPWIIKHRFSNTPEKFSVERYVQGIQEDFDMIEPYLPARPRRILDIGCGVAGIDVLLKRKYPGAQLVLLDGNGDAFDAGWNPKMTGFNSRGATEELLAANGIMPYNIHGWYNVGTTKHLQADLVISLASWGYHYPLSTYRVSGYCIADLRKATEPKRGRVIHEYPKRTRCAWHQEVEE